MIVGTLEERQGVGEVVHAARVRGYWSAGTVDRLSLPCRVPGTPPAVGGVTGSYFACRNGTPKRRQVAAFRALAKPAPLHGAAAIVAPRRRPVKPRRKRKATGTLPVFCALPDFGCEMRSTPLECGDLSLLSPGKRSDHTEKSGNKSPHSKGAPMSKQLGSSTDRDEDLYGPETTWVPERVGGR